MERWLIAAMLALAAVGLAACGAGEEESEATPTGLAASPTAAAEAPFIAIDAPSAGETETVPVHVEGRARVFEGALMVALKDADGRLLCEVTAQASEGAPGVGSWAADIAAPPPTAATAATIEAYSESPLPSTLVIEDIVSVTLSPDPPPIVVTQPRCGDHLSSTFHLEGTASVPEGELVVVVRGFPGAKDLARQAIRASEPAPGRGSFSADLILPPIWSSPMHTTLEAFTLNSDDGSIENLFAVPIVLDIR
jgi:hypothetical protein